MSMCIKIAFYFKNVFPFEMLSLLFVYQELQEFYPGDNVFDATDWCSLSDGFDGRWRKKVNVTSINVLSFTEQKLFS